MKSLKHNLTKAQNNTLADNKIDYVDKLEGILNNKGLKKIAPLFQKLH